jgi:hypothetical protein
MNDSNINLKHILNRLFELRGYVEDIYRSVKMQLGEDASFVHEWCDLRRVQYESETEKEFEGDALFEEVLQCIWKSGKDYVWHYKGLRFRITPFRSGTTDDGGFIIYYGEKHSLITFAGVVRDAVDTDTNVWEAIVAQMFGIADGYSIAVREAEVMTEHNRKLAEQEDLKWKDGYDNATAIKVPEGADGTLACADTEPEPDCPVEVPVVDQAEEPVAGQEEKVCKPKYIIRAGGGPDER